MFGRRRRGNRKDLGRLPRAPKRWGVKRSGSTSGGGNTAKGEEAMNDRKK